MKGLLLAAGEGTRLRPLTYQIPKPLIDICGKPILQYALEQLKNYVDEFIIVVGYKAEQIQNYFGTNFQGRKINYVLQDKLLGTADAVRRARAYLENVERFVLLMGDNIYAKRDIVSCLENGLCILVEEVSEPQKFGIVITDKDGYLLKIEEKPKQPRSNLANTALYVLCGEIFSEIDKLKVSPRGEYDLPEAVVGLSKRQPIRCIKAEGRWLPIGYPEELEAARKIIAEHPEEFL